MRSPFTGVRDRRSTAIGSAVTDTRSMYLARSRDDARTSADTYSPEATTMAHIRYR